MALSLYSGFGRDVPRAWDRLAQCFAGLMALSQVELVHNDIKGDKLIYQAKPRLMDRM